MYRLKIRDSSYTEWVELDVGNEKPAMTYQVNALAELKDRQATYSQSIKLPKTAHNIRALGYLDLTDTVSKKAYHPPQAVLECDGFQISPVGALLYIDKIGKEIECQVVSNAQDFVKSLEETPMDKNAAAGYSLRWSVASVNANGAITLPNGRVALFCSHLSEKNAGEKVSVGLPSYTVFDGDIRSHVPHVRIFDVVEDIVRAKGYTLETDIYNINLALFQSYLACVNPKMSYNPYTYTATLKFRGDYRWASSNEFGTFTEADNSGSFGSGRIVNTYQNGNPTLLMLQDCTLSINSYLKRGAFPPQHNPTIRVKRLIQIMSSLTTVFETVAERTITISKTGANYSENFEVPIKKGQYLRITDIATSINPTEIAGADASGATVEIRAGEETVNEDFQIGAEMDILASLGFGTAKDLLIAFLQLYGLTFEVDSLHKRVRVFTYEHLYLQKNVARDWTDKIEYNTKEVSFSLSGYGRRNNILFKANSDDWDYQNTGFFLVDNLTLENSKDLFTIAIQSGKNYATGSGTLANYPLWEIDYNEDTYEVTGTFKGTANPHLVTVVSGASIAWLLKQGGLERTVSLPRVQHRSVQEYINVFYSSLIHKLLKEAKIIKVNVNLTPLDIVRLDLLVPVIIGGDYYCISKISNFVAGRTTSCELIRM